MLVRTERTEIEIGSKMHALRNSRRTHRPVVARQVIIAGGLTLKIDAVMTAGKGTRMKEGSKATDEAAHSETEEVAALIAPKGSGSITTERLVEGPVLKTCVWKVTAKIMTGTGSTV